MTNNRGISSLGLAHPLYNYRELINCFYKYPVMRFRWLDHFFNENDSTNVQRVLRVSKAKEATVHIINGPGMNNGRTLPHEITYKEDQATLTKKILAGDRIFLGKFRDRCKAIRVIRAIAPTRTLTLSVSPWLEHYKLSKKAFDILAEIIKEEIGSNTPIVSSPRGYESAVPGYLKEVHGDNGRIAAHFHDLDGTDFETTDTLVWARESEKSGAKGTFIWGVGDNGNTLNGPWLPPKERTNFTSEREWKTYREFLRDDALRPAPPFNPKDIAGIEVRPARDGRKSGFTWKQGEGKPIAVAVFPENMDIQSAVIRKDGKVIDSGRIIPGFLHDTRRKIAWFSRHTTEYPDSCVLVINKKIGYLLGRPQFRID